MSLYKTLVLELVAKFSTIANCLREDCYQTEINYCNVSKCLYTWAFSRYNGVSAILKNTSLAQPSHFRYMRLAGESFRENIVVNSYSG
jgi:hypothetical protein